MTRERQAALDEFEATAITMLAPADTRPDARIGAYPRTIDNGGGERLTFHALRRDERGEFLEVSNVVAPAAGPPMHVHHFEEESLTVVRGTMGYQRKGEPVQNARAGETVTFPAGDGHRFWNACDDDLICTGVIRRPGNIEYFLTEIFASAKRNGGTRPGIFDAAYLSHRYRTEFEMLEAQSLGRRREHQQAVEQRAFVVRQRPWMPERHGLMGHVGCHVGSPRPHGVRECSSRRSRQPSRGGVWRTALGWRGVMRLTPCGSRGPRLRWTLGCGGQA